MSLYLREIIHWVFWIYMAFLLVRIIGSWFPDFSRHKLMRFVAFYTDPYLNVFRRVIPPIGRLDLTPMLAYLGLQMIERLLVRILTWIGLC